MTKLTPDQEETRASLAVKAMIYGGLATVISVPLWCFGVWPEVTGIVAIIGPIAILSGLAMFRR
jgi:uncharacterized membrane protein (DUF2068 family)